MSAPQMSPPPISAPAPGAAASPPGGAVASNSANGAAQAKLHATAQKFEAIFVRQMLSQARAADMGDTLFKSQANDTFRQMQDERFADIAAQKGSLGLAAMIEKQLSARLYPADAGAAPARSPGPTSHRLPEGLGRGNGPSPRSVSSD